MQVEKIKIGSRNKAAKNQFIEGLIGRLLHYFQYRRDTDLI